jgi:NADH:ubiquinone oxidoreductase subunit E
VKDGDLRDRLASLAASFPAAQLALLPALRYARRHGEITDGVVAEVAQACQVDEAAVQQFLDAYSALRGEARQAVVCGGLSCFLGGAWHIFAKPENFGLRAGMFERASCLGYCFAAPVVRDVDGCVRHVETRQEVERCNPDLPDPGIHAER